MHARTFVVLAAAAVALAAYAGWIALRPSPSHDPPARAEATSPAPTPRPKAKAKVSSKPGAPAPVRDRAAEPTPEPEPEPEPEPPKQPNITPFDRARELYDQAAETLRRDRDLTEAGTTALLEQAKLAIKDMDALAEPGDERQKRDLHRATEDLARLQARYR